MTEGATSQSNFGTKIIKPMVDYPTYDDGWDLSDVEIVGRDLEWLTDVTGMPRGEVAFDALKRIKTRLEFLEKQYHGQNELFVELPCITGKVPRGTL